ncbi:MAG: hypothetical protein ABI575_07240 [Oxalobacteraceae bacterium]
MSVPLRWDEINKIGSGAHWTVSNIDSRLDQGSAFWATYPESVQGLASAMKILGFKSGKSA